MNTRLRLFAAVLFTALLISGFAIAQATLGNVIKLGTSLGNAMPASSSSIEGGLLYNLDAGAVYFNNGTAWGPIGASAGALGGDYWFNAGNDGGTENYVATNYAIVTYFDGVTYSSAFVEALTPKVISNSRGTTLLRE